MSGLLQQFRCTVLNLGIKLSGDFSSYYYCFFSVCSMQNFTKWLS